MNATQQEMIAAQTLAPMKGMALGPTFLGICCDALLMGVIISQMVTWITNAKHDLRHVRIIVGCAASAALLGTAFTWATYMSAFVYDFGSYARFASFEYFGFYGTLDVLLVVPVQIFFAERSVRINGNNVLLMLVNALLIVATGVMGVAATVASRGQTMFTRSFTVIAISTAWPGVCILTHVFLTSSILFGLYRNRSRSETANKLLTRLIVVSIESQLPSTIVAIIIMIVIIDDHQSPLLPFIVLVHPKVFCVGLLAMVNLKHTWRLKGMVPASYVSDSSPSRKIHVSLGSTVEDFSPQTPKCGDGDSFDNLSRQQSGASIMEAGMGMPLQKLRSTDDHAGSSGKWTGGSGLYK